MFYDTAGEEKYKSIPKNHIKNVQGIILMYDITNKKSFDSIIDWISDVKEIKGENFPMILIGNKIDLNESREVTEEMGNELAEKNQIEFFETSNKDGTNIQEAASDLQEQEKQMLINYIMATIMSRMSPEEAQQYQQ